VQALRGITPLCLAAYLGKEAHIRVLLRAGADVDAVDSNGASALMYAARDGHVDGKQVFLYSFLVVKVLLEFGARHDIRDANGWQAVQYAQVLC
jgi:ankyrin repeat protein